MYVKSRLFVYENLFYKNLHFTFRDGGNKVDGLVKYDDLDY